MGLRIASSWLLACCFLYVSTVEAQWYYGSDDDGSNPRSSWWYYDSDDNTVYGFSSGPFAFLAPSTPGRRALVAHAVVASLVWVILLPLGGILLRLNIRAPWVLQAHAVLQILSYVLYIIAAGLGIWLVRGLDFPGVRSLWSDPHTGLGVAILVLVLFQPVLGNMHHRRYIKQMTDTVEGKPGPPPGRMGVTHMHIWLGRILLFLGIVNGGLGIRLAGRTPFQSNQSTKTAGIVYGTFAALISLFYIVVTFTFERSKGKIDEDYAATDGPTMPMRAMPPGDQPIQETTRQGTSRRDRPPTYTESQDSLHKTYSGGTRYELCSNQQPGRRSDRNVN